MRQVIREGVKTKVLMLSATPVNNRFNDLKNQPSLPTKESRRTSASTSTSRRRSRNVQRRAARLQRVVQARPSRHRTTDRILQMLDFDFFELLDSVTIARSLQVHSGVLRHHRDRHLPATTPPRSIREPLSDLP